MRELRPAPGPSDPVPNQQSVPRTTTSHPLLYYTPSPPPSLPLPSPVQYPPPSPAGTDFQRGRQSSTHYNPNEKVPLPSHQRHPLRHSTTPIATAVSSTSNSIRAQTQPHIHRHSHSHEEACAHIVQFYSSPAHLYNAITSYLLTSFFSAREAAVVLATSQHISALEHQLFHQYCLFPEVMKRRGQLIMLEATEILSILLPPSLLPDNSDPYGKTKGQQAGAKENYVGENEENLTQEKFENFIGPIVEGLHSKGFEKVLVYGELVNVLCERGQHMLALELEEMWNCFLKGKVARQCDVQLLCGYQVEVFDSAMQNESQVKGELEKTPKDGTGTCVGLDMGDGCDEGKILRIKEEAEFAFREICRSHSIVRLTEKYAFTMGFRSSASESSIAAKCASGVPAIGKGITRKFPGGSSGINASFTGEQGAVVASLEQKLRQCEKMMERGKEKERFLRKVLNNLPVGICTVNVPTSESKGYERDSQGTFTNPTLWRIVGLEKIPENMRERNFEAWVENWVHEDDRGRLLQSLRPKQIDSSSQNPNPKTTPSKFTYRVIRTDGTIRYLLGETTFLTDSTAAYIHTVTDLTEVISTFANINSALDNPPYATATATAISESIVSIVPTSSNKSPLPSISSESSAHSTQPTLDRRQSIDEASSPSPSQDTVPNQRLGNKRKLSDESLQGSPSRGLLENRHKHRCGSGCGVRGSTGEGENMESEVQVEVEGMRGGTDGMDIGNEDNQKSIHNKLQPCHQQNSGLDPLNKPRSELPNISSQRPSESSATYSGRGTTSTSQISPTFSPTVAQSGKPTDRSSTTISSSTSTVQITLQRSQSPSSSHAYQYDYYQSQLQDQGLVLAQKPKRKEGSVSIDEGHNDDQLQWKPKNELVRARWTANSSHAPTGDGGAYYYSQPHPPLVHHHNSYSHYQHPLPAPPAALLLSQQNQHENQRSFSHIPPLKYYQHHPPPLPSSPPLHSTAHRYSCSPERSKHTHSQYLPQP